MCEEPLGVVVFTKDPDFVSMIGRALGPEFDLQPASGGQDEPRRAGVGENRVVLLDLRKATGESNSEGLDQMDEVRKREPAPPVIVLLDTDDWGTTRQVFERGAYDVVGCPPNIAELRLVLRRAQRFRKVEAELRDLRAEKKPVGGTENFLVCSEPMQRVLEFTRKVAPCDVSVLVTGETGTGKELLAREIHRLSGRAAGPFVAFSCVNLPETLIEDELFGHQRGAFTGAMAVRKGRIEMADRGTLFLDEIGDLELGLQAKLLRVLQERSFERLGSSTPVSVDFRLICATHRNLEEMVEQGKFRKDLFYRLNVVQVELPPLRERRGGINVLAQHFLGKFGKQFRKGARRFSSQSLRGLEEYSWPGNVRELENVVQRAVVLAEGPTIELWHLPDGLRRQAAPAEVHSYEEEVRDFKRRLILRTLQEFSGNKAESAKALHIARGYLHRLIHQLQIGVTQDESAGSLLYEPVASERVM
jgi:DNA-binding NtrC family response regulator